MITIGSQNTNDIIINDPTVGRQHCKAWILESGEVVLMDLDSKNGTFINDRKVRQFLLRPDSNVKLGSHSLDLSKVKKKLQDIINRDKQDFSKEYTSIFQIMSQYEKRKSKMMKRPLLPILIRLGLGGAVIMAMLFINMDDIIRIALIMSVGMLSVVASLFGPSSTKKAEKMELLKLEYEDQLICPKCKWKLINNSMAYWKARRRCGNSQCDAVY